MAQVRRPVPFRTRKLRPGTAMVLHSRGCGRVARRRIQLSGPSGRVPCGIPGRSLSYFPWGFPSSFGSGNPHFCFSSGFFRAFTDLPATPFRLVEGVFPWLASLSFLRTSRPGIHDFPKGSSPIRGLPADAGRGRPVFSHDRSDWMVGCGSKLDASLFSNVVQDFQHSIAILLFADVACGMQYPDHFMPFRPHASQIFLGGVSESHQHRLATE